MSEALHPDEAHFETTSVLPCRAHATLVPVTGRLRPDTGPQSSGSWPSARVAAAGRSVSLGAATLDEGSFTGEGRGVNVGRRSITGEGVAATLDGGSITGGGGWFDLGDRDR